MRNNPDVLNQYLSDDDDYVRELQFSHTRVKSIYTDEMSANTRMSGKQTTLCASRQFISEELIATGNTKVCSISVIVTIHFSSSVNLSTF